MDYKKIYDELMDKARQSSYTGYTETHHIIPRCMGGTDEPDNLVKLTSRQHFLAHRLLAKIYKDNHKLQLAVYFMSSSKANSAVGCVVSSRVVETLRLRAVQVRREIAGYTEDFLIMKTPIKIPIGLSNTLRYPSGKYRRNAKLETAIKQVTVNLLAAVFCGKSGVIYSRSSCAKKRDTRKGSVSNLMIMRAIDFLCEKGFLENFISDVSTKKVSLIKPTPQILEEFLRYAEVCWDAYETVTKTS